MKLVILRVPIKSVYKTTQTSIDPMPKISCVTNISKCLAAVDTRLHPQFGFTNNNNKIITTIIMWR